MSEQIVKCCVCEKHFSAVYNLNKHARKYHADQINLIIPKKTLKYQCTHCHKNFSFLKNFNFHKKTQHGGTDENMSSSAIKPTNSQCPICQLTTSKEKLMSHFKIEHDIDCAPQNIEFTSFEEFSTWKSEMEHDTKSKYVLERGAKVTKGGNKTIKYCCHRSGKYVAEGKGVRHLKTQGSNKIGGFCPARLKVIINKNEQCKVSFIKQHVGHENDLGHLSLTLQERKTLAQQMSLKIPFTQILDDIRDSVVGSQLERIHLLSRKDLFNIEQSFHLQSSVVRHENDAVSVDAWVKQRESSGCVLFYKTQGTVSESQPDLREEDFVLIIMNPGQEEVFKKYAADCICVDGTHGLNQYDFEMHTLLVIDDVREGFPCAFLISNRSDEAVLKIFFSSVKERTGFQVHCKVFMSDMAEAYYNAWKIIMGPAQNRLFCSWHIDRSWRKNLNKISTKEKQVMVYKYLRTLLQERDENAFSRMLQDFVTTVDNDSGTVEFAEYFKRNYLNNVHCWAYCHRLHTGLNTNMHIERMHRTIKYIYFGGKKVKRLDKALHEIEKFIRDRLFNRLTVLFKGKLTNKLKQLRKSHVKSYELSEQLIISNGGGWEIPSSNSFEMYVLEKRELDLKCNCKLKCTECNVCIHEYTCTCIHSCIQFNMCKHIHLLCRFLKHQKSIQTEEPTVSDERGLVISEDPNSTEVSGIVTGLAFNEQLGYGTSKTRNVDAKQLARERQKLSDNFTQLSESVSNMNMEQVDAAKKVLISLQATLDAIATKDSLKTLSTPSTKISPANTKIIAQRGKLHSTKKKKPKATSLVAPTIDEMQAFAVNALCK